MRGGKDKERRHFFILAIVSARWLKRYLWSGASNCRLGYISHLVLSGAKGGGKRASDVVDWCVELVSMPCDTLAGDFGV